MKNYQSLHYRNYYAQDENGRYIPVTRAECFAKPEEPSAANPYKQRWFYDPEAGYAVRLERNQRGEETYRLGSSSLKRDERYRDWRTGCVLKNKDGCDHNCERCARRNTSRTVELDLKWSVENEDGDAEGRFEPASDDDVAAILEDKLLLEALFSALDTSLTNEQRDLVHAVFYEEKTERELAEDLGLKEPKSVNKRKHRIYEILRQDARLKRFFE
jgi:hypothetical protein